MELYLIHDSLQALSLFQWSTVSDSNLELYRDFVKHFMVCIELATYALEFSLIRF